MRNLRKMNLKEMLLNKNLTTKIVLIGALISVQNLSFGTSSWGSKVNTAANQGANEILGTLDGITKLLMAFAAVAFLIGLASASFKYKGGDQQAYKSLQNLFIGTLVILVGVGLVRQLFF